jgi:hypothetical protein
MEAFHIANDAALWPFDEDQMTVWSEARGTAQPVPGFNLGMEGLPGVSMVSSGI